MSNPTLADWNKLYRAALEYQKIAPWQWMENEDLFGVEDPKSGETGYCSILGNGKQEFGLGIFMGQKGFETYLELFATEEGPEDFDQAVMAPLLSLLFVSRRYMQPEDIEVIQSLGLGFRGRNAWPQFRSQKPGCALWFLEKEDAVYLTAAIEQALVVAERVGHDKLDLLAGLYKGQVFTRFFRNGEWRGEWRKPVVSAVKKDLKAEAAELVSEAELLLLRNSAGAPAGRWEMDIFVLPLPIGKRNTRPSLPLCFLIVDRKIGIIVDVQLTESCLTLAQKRDTVISMLKKAPPLPKDMVVRSSRIKEILAPIAGSLGISLRVGRLPMLDEARANLNERFAGRANKTKE